MTSPEQWNPAEPPTDGTLAEAGVSHVAQRLGDVWQVTLVHAATSTSATARSATRADAMHAAWFALHRTLTENPEIERTTTR